MLIIKGTGKESVPPPKKKKKTFFFISENDGSFLWVKLLSSKMLVVLGELIY